MTDYRTKNRTEEIEDVRDVPIPAKWIRDQEGVLAEENPLKSVFADTHDKIFTRYLAELSFREKIMAGVPKSRKIIEGWIRSQAGVEQAEEVYQMTMRTLVETGVEVHQGMTFEELQAASEKVAANQSTNGFKRDRHGLYIEDRQIKAMIKESVNVLYADKRWGATRKGPKNFTAERVFVEPPRLYLGRDEPDGVELVIGHVNDKAGKRSTLAYHEYVEKPVILVEIECLRDEIDLATWAEIMTHAESNGLGALRSQSFGRFFVTSFERVK